MAENKEGDGKPEKQISLRPRPKSWGCHLQHQISEILNHRFGKNLKTKIRDLDIQRVFRQRL